MNDSRGWVWPLCMTLGACFNPESPALTDDTGATGGTSPGTTSAADPDTTSGEASTASVDGSTTHAVDPDTGSTSAPTTASGSTGEPPGDPEIDVTVDARAVADGAAVALADPVDVGASGTALVVEIANVGDGTLLIGGAVGTGPDADDFALGQDSLATRLAPGETSQFTVALAPVRGGAKSLTLEISSNDADEATYVLTVDGHTTPNTFRNIAPLQSPSGRFNPGMAALPDGRVVLFGGRDADGIRLGDTWMFAPDQDDWTELFPPSAPVARDAHRLAAIGDDTILLFGGNTAVGNGGVGTDETWIFDAAAGTWTQVVTPAPPPRFQHMMVSLGDFALLFGGRSGPGGNGDLGDTWLFDASLSTWSDLAPATSPGPRASGAMAYAGNNIVTLYGGLLTTNVLGETFNYSIANNLWTTSAAPNLPGNRAVLEGEFLAAGAMVVFSGKVDDCCVDPSAGTFAYDPVGNAWSDLAPVAEPTPRFNYGMAAIPGRNRAIVFGGLLQNTGVATALQETWEYVGPLP